MLSYVSMVIKIVNYQDGSVGVSLVITRDCKIFGIHMPNCLFIGNSIEETNIYLNK